MPFGPYISYCNCSAELDVEGYHLSTCMLGEGHVWEHNNLVLEWCQCLRDLQLHHRKEPKHQYVNSEDRPDVIVMTWGRSQC